MRVKLYSFDGVDAALDLLPLAARRALDAAGLKLSLEAWRGLPLDKRRAIAEAGSEPTVASERVASALPPVRPRPSTCCPNLTFRACRPGCPARSAARDRSPCAVERALAARSLRAVQGSQSG